MSTSQENFTDAELESLSIRPILIKFRHIGLVNALSKLKKLNEQLTPDELTKLYNDYYNFTINNAAMNDDENKRIISEAVNEYITSFLNHHNLYTLDISTKLIEKFYEENQSLPKIITKKLITKYNLNVFEDIARGIGLDSFATAKHTRNINTQRQELGSGYIMGGGNSKSNSSEKRPSSTRRRPSRKSSATKRRRPRRRTARK